MKNNNKLENKIGMNNFRLFDIERKIVNLKLNLIDEYFTFNKNSLDFEYLKEINNFLFSDFYNETNLGTRKISKVEKELINEYLNKIVYLCKNKPEEQEEILNLIKKIWHLQPFKWGNTRTLFAYLKILNSAFLLDLTVDTNKEIASKPSMFDLNNFVNQKRLTKDK